MPHPGETGEISIQMGKDGLLCPHCSRPKELKPTLIKPISLDPETRLLVFSLKLTCPTEDGGCGNSLGFVTRMLDQGEPS